MKKSIEKRLLELADLALQAEKAYENRTASRELYEGLNTLRIDMIKESNKANEMVMEAHHKDRHDPYFLLQETDNAFEYLQEALRYDADEGRV